MKRRAVLGGALAALACAPLLAQGSLPDVDIVPVGQWGGTPADAAKARLQQITHITLHHQGESFPPGRDVIQYLRALQQWSRNTKHWIDIPYHFVVDLEGRIYEARQLTYAGDTNTEYDPIGHALIEVVGNFEEVEPNQKQLDALVALMAKLSARYQVAPENIRGHKDYSAQTVCPGRNLYAYLASGYLRDRVRARLALGR